MADESAVVRRTFTDKTLVAWVAVADPGTRGGSVLTVENPGGEFDAIVFGEIQPGRWMAGSNFFLRTQQQQDHYPLETARSGELVQIAIVYRGRQVTIYRNGEPYASYQMGAEPASFSTDSLVLIGLRHRDAGGPRFFEGTIADARVYDVALEASQIAILRPGELSDPPPLAWWCFADGKPVDRMGAFPAGHLVGGARIAEGRLHVGANSYLLAGSGLPPDRASEEWPTYHISALPDEGMAMPYDANGCMFWNGRYHLMYIFQDPTLPNGGHCWGHLSSADLVNWTYHPAALVPEPGDPDSGIFSGNAFISKEGVPMLCWFGIDAGVCVATAQDDDLIRWKKHPQNPIIPVPKEGEPGYGVYTVWDPYLWLEGETYYCLLGGNRLPNGKDTLYVCRSTDLVHWEPLHPFYEHPDLSWTTEDEDCSCPDFFPLADKHVLMCISHKVGARAYIGRFDRKQARFFPEQHVRMNWPGGMFFAPESLLSPDGRRIFWAWVTDPRIAPTQRATGSGVQSLPRVLRLADDGTVRITPAEELQALRRNHRRVEGLLLASDADLTVDGICGRALELVTEIDPGDAQQVGLKVRCSPDGREETAIWYHPDRATLGIDMSRSTLRKDVTYGQPPFSSALIQRASDNPAPLETVDAPLALPGENLRLRVFLDGPVLEVFANDRQCVTQQIFPSQPESLQVRACARGGTATVVALDAWDMAPATFTDQRCDPRVTRHYHPRGMSVWDTWYLQRGNETHVFHLQLRRDHGGRPPEDDGSIGHAVSTDLLHWRELPVALRKGPVGSYDDSWSLFTGCCVEHEGRMYLFYTGNHDQGGRIRQSICLATSTDGVHFERYPGNPVIEPDPARYYSIHEPPAPFPHAAHPHVDCRDLAVVRDPHGSGWLGYVVMRRKGQPDAFRSACIALCRSEDLVHWEVGDPVCTPNRFNCFEVPDVFELDGRWFMIALTGDNYGQSHRWADPGITFGTVVFQAEEPQGPFIEIRDNLLLASTGQQGYSARTVERHGERLMLFTRHEGRFGRLSWPVKLVPREGGGLNPTYWHGIDAAFGEGVYVDAVRVDPGRPQLLAGLPTTDRVFHLTARIELGEAAAGGIAFGQTPSAEGGFAVLLRPREGILGVVSLVSLSDGQPRQNRYWILQPSPVHNLRLLAVNGMVDVYVDDLLVINTYLPDLRKGAFSALAEGAAVRISEVTYRGL